MAVAAAQGHPPGRPPDPAGVPAPFRAGHGDADVRRHGVRRTAGRQPDRGQRPDRRGLGGGSGLRASWRRDRRLPAKAAGARSRLFAPGGALRRGAHGPWHRLRSPAPPDLQRSAPDPDRLAGHQGRRQRRGDDRRARRRDQPAHHLRRRRQRRRQRPAGASPDQVLRYPRAAVGRRGRHGPGRGPHRASAGALSIVARDEPAESSGGGGGARRPTRRPRRRPRFGRWGAGCRPTPPCRPSS